MPSNIDERFDSLERSNRRLKTAMSACVLVAVALLFMGAKPPTPKVIEAEKFVLKDNSGNERGQLFATQKAWGLVFFNEDGTKAATLAVNSELSAVLLFDHNGNIRHSLTATLDESAWKVFHPGSEEAQFQVVDNGLGTVLDVRDRANKPRVELGVSSRGSALNLSDSNSRIRAAIVGEEMGFASFANDGSLDWSPGWEKFSPEEQEQMKALMKKVPN
jgi:hypothetical protein